MWLDVGVWCNWCVGHVAVLCRAVLWSTKAGTGRQAHSSTLHTHTTPQLTSADTPTYQLIHLPHHPHTPPQPSHVPPPPPPLQVRGDQLKYMDPGQRAGVDAIRNALGADYEAKLRAEAGESLSRRGCLLVAVWGLDGVCGWMLMGTGLPSTLGSTQQAEAGRCVWGWRPSMAGAVRRHVGMDKAASGRRDVAGSHRLCRADPGCGVLNCAVQIGVVLMQHSSRKPDV